MKRIVLLCLLVTLMALPLSGCLPGDGTYESGPANFLSGVWHGWVAPVSLVIGLFNSDIRVYEPINIGWWYDLGFYVAVISGFGGLSLTRRARSKRRED